jgi:hypothetical protein
MAHGLQIRLEATLGFDIGVTHMATGLGHFAAVVALVVALPCAFGFDIFAHDNTPEKI